MSSIEGLNPAGALNAYFRTQDETSKLLGNMSTGSDLTASSDPAGLSIDQLMNAQMGGLQKASANTQTGISMLQVMGGALGQQSKILEGIRDVALQAANGTNSPGALQALGAQVKQQLGQLDQIAQSTSFNNTNLLDGSAGSVKFQTGPSGSSSDQTTVNLANTGVNALGLSGIDSQIAQGGDMSNVLKAIDTASQALSSAQGNVGASTKGMVATLGNISQTMISVGLSASGISDTDMAQSVMQLTSSNMKSDFAIALMGQSNHINQQNALSLLKSF